MYYKCLSVVIFLTVVKSFGFEACRHYFSGHFQGNKNIRLSKLMVSLQEDIWEIQSFLRLAKVSAHTKEDLDKALHHKDRFLRIALSMHEKHDSELAPGRIFEIPAERRSSYLAMYSEFTEKFYQLSSQMSEAFLKSDWKKVESLMMSIDSLTARAHMRVESNNY